MRSDGTMYSGFYDRHVIVAVSSEPGNSSAVPEDKQIIPDDNILSYEIMPGMNDRVIRISVSLRSSYKFAFALRFFYKVMVKQILFLD